jgi:Holliday junction resolvase
MGKMQRAKGARVEREFVNLHKEMGVPAERAPYSGAVKGRLTDMQGEDIKIEINGVNVTAEVKARKEGWKTIYDQIARTDILFLKANNKSPLVVLQWDTWAWLLKEVTCDGAKQNISSFTTRPREDDKTSGSKRSGRGTRRKGGATSDTTT